MTKNAYEDAFADSYESATIGGGVLEGAGEGEAASTRAIAQAEIDHLHRLEQFDPPAEIAATHEAWIEGELSFWERNLECFQFSERERKGCGGRDEADRNLFRSPDPASDYLRVHASYCFATFGYSVPAAHPTEDLSEAQCREAFAPKTVEAVRAGRGPTNPEITITK